MIESRSDRYSSLEKPTGKTFLKVDLNKVQMITEVLVRANNGRVKLDNNERAILEQVADIWGYYYDGLEVFQPLGYIPETRSDEESRRCLMELSIYSRFEINRSLSHESPWIEGVAEYTEIQGVGNDNPEGMPVLGVRFKSTEALEYFDKTLKKNNR